MGNERIATVERVGMKTFVRSFGCILDRFNGAVFATSVIRDVKACFSKTSAPERLDSISVRGLG